MGGLKSQGPLYLKLSTITDQDMISTMYMYMNVTSAPSPGGDAL